MTNLVKFSRATSYDSIGTEGFVTTTGVEITPVPDNGQGACILLNPIGKDGYSVGNCRVALDMASMADIAAAFLRMMAEDAATARAALDACRGRTTGGPVPARMPADAENLYPLSVEELERRFGTDGEAPEYPRADWMEEVRHGDTGSGYWDWVSDRCYNETFERTMDIDHRAERLLVDRAGAAAARLDTYGWKGFGGVGDHGPWVEVRFEDHVELRKCIELQDGSFVAFHVEFQRGSAVTQDAGHCPFDPDRESLG